jgi:hypothetical protein
VAEANIFGVTWDIGDKVIDPNLITADQAAFDVLWKVGTQFHKAGDQQPTAGYFDFYKVHTEHRMSRPEPTGCY